MSGQKAVLVLGDDLRSFLAVVRSLGRRGLRVDVCPENWASPALSSRYISRAVKLPPYALAPEDWVTALRAQIDQGGYELIIPCTDRAILPLMQERAHFADCRLALPNDETYRAFYDKLATRDLAERIGVPVAPGRRLTTDDSAAGLVEAFGLPLVVKPAHSYTVAALHSRGKVRICQTEEAVEVALPPTETRAGTLVEGHFAGQGAGISILANHGRVLLAFQHGRLREPITGGGSSYRIAEPCDPAMLQAVEQLAEATALHGVAMFEFRRNNADGTFILVEVNARFWGSLPLAVAAGVDFPGALYDLLTDGKEPAGRDYRAGVRARNVTADFDATLMAFSYLWQHVGWGSALEFLFGAIASWFRVLGGRETHDSFAWGDSGAWRREIGALFARIGTKLWNALPLAAPLRHRRAIKTLQRLRPKTITVLCQGNICRSPFAAARLQQQLGDQSGIDVHSAGLMERIGRPSPDLAMEAAAKHGTDLSGHRSVYADDAMVEQSDLVVVFDAINEAGLMARGLWAPDKVVRLGDLLPVADGGGPISDPIDGDAAVYAACYDRIDRATAALAALIAGQAP